MEKYEQYLEKYADYVTEHLDSNWNTRYAVVGAKNSYFNRRCALYRAHQLYKAQVDAEIVSELTDQVQYVAEWCQYACKINGIIYAGYTPDTLKQL